jgi:hypothetical protein
MFSDRLEGRTVGRMIAISERVLPVNGPGRTYDAGKARN